MIQSILRGSLGLGMVGLAAFSVWAGGGKWFQAHFGHFAEAALYGACALVFLFLSGLLMHRLVIGRGAFLRFYSIFIPAFFAYAIIWCAAWFLLRFGLGEWLGSFLGTLSFAAVAGWRFGCHRGFLKASLILFGFHSIGYFLGGQTMHWISSHPGSALIHSLPKTTLLIIAKLSWGLLYGLGFGAGIGFVFYTFQSPQPSKSIPNS